MISALLVSGEQTPISQAPLVPSEVSVALAEAEINVSEGEQARGVVLWLGLERWGQGVKEEARVHLRRMK